MGKAVCASLLFSVLGNDVGNEPNLLTFLNNPLVPPDFGFAGQWLSAGKEIQNGSGSNGILTSTGGGLSGGWTLTLANQFIQALVISVKGGPGWSAYFFDPATLATSFSGTWTTLGLLNPGGNRPDISHISAYYVATPIPTPALAPAAIGAGLALLRKKKQEEEEAKA